MSKKIKIFIFFMIFSLFCIKSFLVIGTNTTYSFSEIGSIATTSSIISMDCLDNELAFLAEINRGLTIYNITNPSNCIELDYHPLSFVHDIALDFERKLVYITASTGVNIFDYSDPNELTLLSTYLNYTTSTFIQLKGELLFIGAEDRGLQIVNVTNPNEPVMIGNWKDSIGHVGPLYIIGNYVFAGIRIPNINAPPTIIDLKILDISDPTNITLVSIVDTGGGYDGGAPKAHTDDVVYLNDYDEGLKILNFTDPSDVSVIGIYSDGGSFNDLELINDDIVYLADDGEGLKVIDCSDPENLFLVDSYQHQWRTIRVVTKENRVYLATLSGGVRILSAEIKTRKAEINPMFIVSGLAITSIILLLKKRKLCELE